MRILAILFGVVLLFPGACSLGFLFLGIGTLPPLTSADWRRSELWSLIGIAAFGWGVCFLISFAGIMMIRNALKKPPE